MLGLRSLLTVWLEHILPSAGGERFQSSGIERTGTLLLFALQQLVQIAFDLADDSF